VEAIRQGDIPGVQLRRRQALPVAAEEAWRWLVEPARLARWLASTARLVGEGEGGGAALLLEEAAPPWEGGAAGAWRERGRTLEAEPSRRWVLAWERLEAGWPVATRVVVTLHATAGGCELDVLHQGFERLPLSSCLTVWEAYRRRWRVALERLAQAVEGRAG
jgi:uncharacterized protein YndB with AHSA1/START domain